MKKLIVLMMILICSGFIMAQSKSRVIRFDGSDASAEDTANFLIDNKFAVEVEYDDKLETVRLKFSKKVWSGFFEKGTWFLNKNNRLEILRDSQYAKKYWRTIPFSAVNYYWNMAEQRYLLRSTFKKRF